MSKWTFNMTRLLQTGQKKHLIVHKHYKQLLNRYIPHSCGPTILKRKHLFHTSTMIRLACKHLVSSITCIVEEPIYLRTFQMSSQQKAPPLDGVYLALCHNLSMVDVQEHHHGVAQTLEFQPALSLYHPRDTAIGWHTWFSSTA